MRMFADLLKFRNGHHFLWFILSIINLFVAVNGSEIPHPIILFCLHGFLTLFAIVFVKILHQETYHVSADCIWFNALMSVLYSVIIAIRLN